MGHRALLAYRREADDDSLDSAGTGPKSDSAADARHDPHRWH